jgi:hypothetical protein
MRSYWSEGGVVLMANSAVCCTGIAAVGRTARAETRSPKNKGHNADCLDCHRLCRIIVA